MTAAQRLEVISYRCRSMLLLAPKWENELRKKLTHLTSVVLPFLGGFIEVFAAHLNDGDVVGGCLRCILGVIDRTIVIKTAVPWSSGRLVQIIIVNEHKILAVIGATGVSLAGITRAGVTSHVTENRSLWNHLPKVIILQCRFGVFPA